jgi:hypothetical protein
MELKAEFLGVSLVINYENQTYPTVRDYYKPDSVLLRIALVCRRAVAKSTVFNIESTTNYDVKYVS